MPFNFHELASRPRQGLSQLLKAHAGLCSGVVGCCDVHGFRCFTKRVEVYDGLGKHLGRLNGSELSWAVEAKACLRKADRLSELSLTATNQETFSSARKHVIYQPADA